MFDVRNITSPIIVFTSTGDNISPPPQTLGWILDLYRDVDDIRATGRTIVYCLNHKIGHLAIFVSTKVGAKEDEEFVQLMDVIDCLPPGLYEMVISPRPADVPAAASSPATGSPASRPARSTTSARSGATAPTDDRAFAAVARLSELNLSLYRTFMQPLVRALANQPAADLAAALNPLRLSYTIFADSNPWMKGVQKLAAERGGGAQAGRGRQSVPGAADAGLRPDHRRPGCLSRWRVTRWPSRCSSVFTARHSCRRSSASTTRSEVRPIARHFARKAGGTDRPRRTPTRRS